MLGTPIIVIKSNCKRKAGPKKGSLGFIISNQNVLFPLKSNNAVKTLSTILFFKYGFEQKYRAEIKKVYITTPTLRCLTKGKTFTIQQQLNYLNRKNKILYDTIIIAPLFNHLILNSKNIVQFFRCLYKDIYFVDYLLINNLKKKKYKNKKLDIINRIYQEELSILQYLVNKRIKIFEKIIVDPYKSKTKNKKYIQKLLECVQLIKSLILNKNKLIRNPTIDFIYSISDDILKYKFTDNEYLLLLQYKHELIQEGFKLFKKHKDMK